MEKKLTRTTSNEANIRITWSFHYDPEALGYRGNTETIEVNAVKRVEGSKAGYH